MTLFLTILWGFIGLLAEGLIRGWRSDAALNRGMIGAVGMVATFLTGMVIWP